MKQIIVLCLLLATLVSTKIVDFSDTDYESLEDYEQQEPKNSHKGQYKGWMQKYRHHYRPEEEEIRLHYFEHNLQVIENHNHIYKPSYEMGANKFADLTDEEFRSIYLMVEDKMRNISIKRPKQKYESDQQLQYGDSKEKNETKMRLLQTKSAGQIDWRTKIRFAPIKSQGKCASCYAFAATAVVQLHVALRLRSRRQPTFSEQQLVDCCQAYGYNCQGCGGGFADTGIQFFADHGITTLESYPYKAIAQPCKLKNIKTLNYIDKANSFGKISGEAKILDYLLHKGPLAIPLDSNTWKLYSKGEFDGCNSGLIYYNHVITLVGVTKTSWIIRNSWGADWGEDGYIRIKRGGNPCGIFDISFYPNLVK